MEILRLLTLIWVGVLVAALASGLIAIWRSLRAIERSLGATRSALAEVRERTAPLREPLEALEDVARRTAEAMAGAEEAIRERGPTDGRGERAGAAREPGR